MSRLPNKSGSPSGLLAFYGSDAPGIGLGLEPSHRKICKQTGNSKLNPVSEDKNYEILNIAESIRRVVLSSSCMVVYDSLGTFGVVENP